MKGMKEVFNYVLLYYIEIMGLAFIGTLVGAICVVLSQILVSVLEERFPRKKKTEVENSETK